jgi:(2Fe-2S) ferredoxin
MPKFERHVFVCGNQRDPDHPRGCCAAKEAGKIRTALKNAIAKRGLISSIRINEAGCLGQCEHGPTVVVYPDQIWYGFVRREDVDDIVTAHLIGGEPVHRLVLADGCVNTNACPHRPIKGAQSRPGPPASQA